MDKSLEEEIRLGQVDSLLYVSKRQLIELGRIEGSDESTRTQLFGHWARPWLQKPNSSLSYLLLNNTRILEIYLSYNIIRDAGAQFHIAGD
jgi:hypothetical protein